MKSGDKILCKKSNGRTVPGVWYRIILDNIVGEWVMVKRIESKEPVIIQIHKSSLKHYFYTKKRTKKTEVT